jgi:sugar lactone lactonase YvrE
VQLDVAREARNVLGEGPVWDEREQALYWVDIVAPAVHRLDPATDTVLTWPIDADVGCVVLREQGGAVVALRTGIQLLDFETGTLTPLCNPPRDEARNRFNDGKCDARGRLWAGTLDDLAEPRGALYRIEPDGSCTEALSGVACSNGLGWSPDGRTFYYTDSWTHRIDAYDFDEEHGTLAGRRLFARDEDGAVPDGLAVDSEGFVWSAKWDGWRVVRYAPDGSVDAALAVPVQRPTSVAFGGRDLDRLFVTSARIGLSDAELAAGPLAGAVFVVDAGVRGIPVGRFGG